MFYTYIAKVFSQQFCDDLIAQVQSRGFHSASVNYYGEQRKMPNVRNNERLEFADGLLASELEHSVQEHCPEFPYVLNGHSYRKLSEEFRAYRYSPGQYFKPHKDGHVRTGGMESLVTVLLYLNDTQGGQTILMPQGAGQPGSWIEIEPQAGSVLLFEHDFWHEGKPVEQGHKYVLRTNMLFEA